MKMKILMLSFMLISARAFGGVFQLDYLRDGLFLGGSAGLNLLSLYIESQQTPLTPSAVSNLDSTTINLLDQWVTQMWSPLSSGASDIGMYSSIALPALLLLSPHFREEWLPHSIMYTEAQLLSSGLTGLVKGLAGRPRPYAYNPEVSISTKLDSGTIRSFFSGHTSSSFTGAAYLATVFSLYYPDSPWRIPVIISAFTLATATGILRITAGKHFVTDVIVGAITGTLSGYLVPLSHFKKTGSGISLTQGDNTGIYCKLHF